MITYILINMVMMLPIAQFDTEKGCVALRDNLTKASVYSGRKVIDMMCVSAESVKK